MAAARTSRRQGPRAYTWQVGVDNAFGWLLRPDVEPALVESVSFVGLRRGLTVDLLTGVRYVTAADGTAAWLPVDPGVACAIAGIPAPVVDGRAEVGRRVDPFHVERLRSPLWGALVEAVRWRRLPCGHALWLARHAGGWNRRWTDATREAPEKFASHVCTHVARGMTPVDAVRYDLADTAELDGESDLFGWLLDRSGWQPVLDSLEQRIAERAAALAARYPSPGPIARPTQAPPSALPLAA